MMSVMLSTIDFDPQALADKEEEEHDREDAQQQQEEKGTSQDVGVENQLKAFLDQELDGDDDDLLDASFTPHQSQHSLFGHDQQHSQQIPPQNKSQQKFENYLAKPTSNKQLELTQDDDSYLAAQNGGDMFVNQQNGYHNHVHDPYGEEVYQDVYHTHHQSQFHGVNFEDQSTVPYKSHQYNGYADENHVTDGQNGRDNQLQVLYAARGNKIEELQNHMVAVEEESAKEKRILQHKLTLITGERDGLKESNNQLHSLLQEHKQNIASLNQQVEAEQQEIHQLTTTLSEYDEKLQLSESTIDTLQGQIKMMNQTESLSRARSHHESMLATMRKKHEDEILSLKEKLDDLQQALAWKVVLMYYKEKVLSKDVCVKIQVEDNNRYREMLDSNSSSSEIGILRQRLSAEEKKNKQCCDSLERERKSVLDLEDQLKMFEAVVANKPSNQFSSTPYNIDLQAQLKTPVSRSVKIAKNSVRRLLLMFELSNTTVAGRVNRFQAANTVSSETPVNGESSLRNDLVKSLAMNREKRGEIKALQDQIKLLSKGDELKDVFNTDKHKNKDLSQLMNDVCEKCEETRLGADRKVKSLKDEHTKAFKIVQDENAEIKSNMAELVKNFDKEKTELYAKQNDVMIQFVDDAKEKVRDELTRLHKSEITKLEGQIEQLNAELLYTKEEYLKLSEEMKSFENHVESETKYQNEMKISDMKLKLETEYKNELLKQENQLTSNYIKDLENEKEKWNSKHEKRLKDEIEKAVTLAKVELQQQVEEKNAKAIENAVDMCRQDEELKFEEQQLKIEEKMNQLRNEWEEKLLKREKDLQTSLDKLSDELKEERSRCLSYKIRENNLVDQINTLQDEVDNLLNKLEMKNDENQDQLQEMRFQEKMLALENEKVEVLNMLKSSEEKVENVQEKLQNYRDEINEYKNKLQVAENTKQCNCKSINKVNDSLEAKEFSRNSVSLQDSVNIPDVSTRLSFSRNIIKCQQCKHLQTLHNEKESRWKKRESDYLNVLSDAQGQLQKALLNNSDETPEYIPENHAAGNRMNYILRTKEKLWSIKELSCKRDIDVLKEENVKCQGEIDALKIENEIFEEQCQQFEVKAVHSRTELINKDAQISNLYQEITDLNTKLENVNRVLSSVRQDVSEKELKVDQLMTEKSRIEMDMRKEMEDVVLAEKKKWQNEASLLQAEKLKEESERLKNNLLSDLKHQTDNERIERLQTEHAQEIKSVKQNFRDKLERISESKKKWMKDEEERRLKMKKSFDILLKERLSELQSKHEVFTREQQAVWERNMLQLQQEQAKLLTTARSEVTSKQTEHDEELKELKIELSNTKKRTSHIDDIDASLQAIYCVNQLNGFYIDQGICDDDDDPPENGMFQDVNVNVQRLAQTTHAYEQKLKNTTKCSKTNSTNDSVFLDQASTSKPSDATAQLNDETIERMRQFYLKTLQKINEDVSNHVRKTRERAAQQIKEAITKERKLLRAKYKDTITRSSSVTSTTKNEDKDRPTTTPRTTSSKKTLSNTTQGSTMSDPVQSGRSRVKSHPVKVSRTSASNKSDSYDSYTPKDHAQVSNPDQDLSRSSLSLSLTRLTSFSDLPE